MALVWQRAFLPHGGGGDWHRCGNAPLAAEPMSLAVNTETVSVCSCHHSRPYACYHPFSLTISAHAILAPACPVVALSAKPPAPPSSMSAWIMTARPIMKAGSCARSEMTASLKTMSTLPPASDQMDPRSPVWRIGDQGKPCVLLPLTSKCAPAEVQEAVKLALWSGWVVGGRMGASCKRVRALLGSMLAAFASTGAPF